MLTFPKSVNTSGYTGYFFRLIPWSSSLANQELAFQGGWHETQYNQVALTQAYYLKLPAAAPPRDNAKRASCDTYSTTNTTGVDSASFAYNPVFCYTYN
ncbi:MAG: hypothetical protein KDC87_06850 [Planctomycetes bacterium]|nr:hypothetical protein [Planctomycetota bacterium]MCB9869630.1 hypothetical protein [Planctomycetota bacterium]